MSAALIACILLVYFVAGFGMPLVSLALLATVLGLADAIILMVVPSLVTNFWQGLFGGHLIALLRRLWSLLLPLCVVTWFASGILSRRKDPPSPSPWVASSSSIRSTVWPGARLAAAAS